MNLPHGYIDGDAEAPIVSLSALISQKQMQFKRNKETAAKESLLQTEDSVEKPKSQAREAEPTSITQRTSLRDDCGQADELYQEESNPYSDDEGEQGKSDKDHLDLPQQTAPKNIREFLYNNQDYDQIDIIYEVDEKPTDLSRQEELQTDHKFTHQTAKQSDCQEGTVSTLERRQHSEQQFDEGDQEQEESQEQEYEEDQTYPQPQTHCEDSRFIMTMLNSQDDRALGQYDQPRQGFYHMEEPFTGAEEIKHFQFKDSPGKHEDEEWIGDLNEENEQESNQNDDVSEEHISQFYNEHHIKMEDQFDHYALVTANIRRQTCENETSTEDYLPELEACGMDDPNCGGNYQFKSQAADSHNQLQQVPSQISLNQKILNRQ